MDVIAPANTPDPADADTLAQKVIRTVWRLAAKAYRRQAVKLEGLLPIAGWRRFNVGFARNYELLFVSTQSAHDLYDVGSCARWRSMAGVSVCYIDELFPSDVSALGSLLTVLKRFDHIFVSVRDTVGPLAMATGRPCHYFALSTDTFKFCPYPDAPKRVIDVYSMGSSRPPETHKALLRMAEVGDWYYIYDTVGNGPVTSHAEHRSRLAEMIKRSRFFLVKAARWYDPERTGPLQELGLRYFEGAAAGAVLLGDAPCNASFNEYFDWQDSVIPVPSDSDDITNIIAELDADPSRLERISKTNAVNSLRRHDHVYRWAQVLSTAGLNETRAMADRRRELEALAAAIERTIPASR